MKKIITFFVAGAMLSITSSGQLKVNTQGQVIVGGNTVASQIISGSSIPEDATIDLMGAGKYGSDAKLAFGTRNNVSISESAYDAMFRYGAMILHGDGGLLYKSSASTIFSYDPQLTINGDGSLNPFGFKTTVSAPQYLTISDERSKTNIQPLENTGDLLMNLNPISYNLIIKEDSDYDTDKNTDIDSGKSKSSSDTSQNKNNQYGFLAQEVRDILPDLVYEDSDGNLSLDYTGFIPLLVDAVKSLQTQVSAQAEIIESLTGVGPEKKGIADIGNNESSTVAKLAQNRPNPFRTSTTINCVIPDNSSSARLYVYDLTGSQKLCHDISERGNVSVTIEGNSLSAGMYIYTLVVDGSEIDSKRMILTD